MFLWMSCLITAIVGPILSANEFKRMVTCTSKRARGEREGVERESTKNLNDQIAKREKWLDGNMMNTFTIRNIIGCGGGGGGATSFEVDGHEGQLLNGGPNFGFRHLLLSLPLHDFTNTTQLAR